MQFCRHERICCEKNSQILFSKRTYNATQKLLAVAILNLQTNFCKNVILCLKQKNQTIHYDF